MKKYLPILKKCPLFFNVSDEDLIIMLNCLGAKVDVFDKKYTIFNEGKPIKHMGILLSGKAQIIQMDFYGNKSIIANVEPGELFAEAFACNNVTLPVSIVADEKSEIMFISSAHILHTCSNACSFHNQLIYNLMKSLAEKNVAFYEKIEVTSKRTTREKLLTYLDLQAKKHGNSTFNIPFDRQGLADYLDVDRSGLSVEIGKLKKEGVIDSYKSSFKLLF